MAGDAQGGGESKSIVVLLFLSTVCIGLFYGAGLMWGEHTHLSMVEYWRWWVVHLWVEGFFEVFATAVIAFLFTRLGLLRASTATVAVLFATIVFLSGGVLGTLHHLYFTGTPTAVIALGASFSRAGGGAAGVHRLRGLSHLQARPAPRRGCSAIAGRSCSSLRWRSGTWSAPGCSAS